MSIRSAETSRLRPEWFRAAGEVGLEFVRFAPDTLPAAGRDFLIGDADLFERVNETDLAMLREALDAFERHGVKVVLTMFNLPGCRWTQKNGDRDDGRIWRDRRYWEQAQAFWRQLASRLKDHPAVVAYNPLNEPHPDREFGFEEEDLGRFEAWLNGARGTAADLDAFNREMVRAIRSVDRDTPIILDGWFYAAPAGLRYARPVPDAHILYAFHNPGPWVFTTFRVNKGRFAYPAAMPDDPGDGTRRWTSADLARRIRPVEAFARRHKIPRHRIVASEFWCDRRVRGAREHLADLIRLYNARGWHWAFYQFRADDAWGGLDYDLGTGALPPAFWQAVQRGDDPEAHKNRRDNPLWQVIKREFQSRK